MGKVHFKVEGLDKLSDTINGYIRDVDGVVQNSLQRCGNDLQSKAQKLTPVDSGALKASAFTQDEKDVIVGFEEEYAPYVHEDLTAQHPNGGQAKFLEQPFKEHQDKYLGFIRRDIKKNVLKITRTPNVQLEED